MEATVRAVQRITLTLFLVMSTASAGMIAVATVNPILAADLSRREALAGLPSAVVLLGGALSAAVWGVLMDRLGRRAGLLLALALGIAGAGGVLFSVSRGSFAAFLLAMLLMGVANSAIQLSRFFAAEVYPPSERGRAISNVVLGGTVGAIVGPMLVGPSGRWAMQAGIGEIGGPYAACLLLLAGAAALVFSGLRPEPRDLGREIARLHPSGRSSEGVVRPIREILRQPPAFLALTAMALGTMVMVMVMVITSLHMRNHGHALSQLSVVISSHTLGMYAFSLVSGRLVDRWGRRRVILAGSGTLVLACAAATLSPDVLPLAVALFLLGLGWNFCYVGGSTLLSDQLSSAERARTQGMNDLLVGLASASGSLASGLVFDVLGYGAMAWVGAAFALIPLGLALRASWLRMERPTPAGAATL
jgi:MFS family permease